MPRGESNQKAPGSAATGCGRRPNPDLGRRGRWAFCECGRWGFVGVRAPRTREVICFYTWRARARGCRRAPGPFRPRAAEGRHPCNYTPQTGASAADFAQKKIPWQKCGFRCSMKRPDRHPALSTPSMPDANSPCECLLVPGTRTQSDGAITSPLRFSYSMPRAARRATGAPADDDNELGMPSLAPCLPLLNGLPRPRP